MLPGEFELYGHRFRWSDGDAADVRSDESLISLIRMRQPFPSEAVDWLSRGNERIPSYGKLGSCSAYHFPGVAHFLFPADGRFVKIYLDPDADHAALEFALYRGVLPRILHLRGTTCLHASAIAVEGGVIAFCGPSGAGKSTLAAALVTRGSSLVSDDVLPLCVRSMENHVMAGPGLPELRLYPTTADCIGIGGQVSAPLQGQTKARWQPRRAPDAPLRLLAVYLLEPSLREQLHEPALVRPLPGPQALVDLISNSFWVHPSETGPLGKDLICFGQLLRSVAVSRLAFELSDTGFTAIEKLIASTAKVMAR